MALTQNAARAKRQRLNIMILKLGHVLHPCHFIVEGPLTPCILRRICTIELLSGIKLLYGNPDGKHQPPIKKGQSTLCRCINDVNLMKKTKMRMGKNMEKHPKPWKNYEKYILPSNFLLPNRPPSPPRRWPVACAEGVPHVVPSAARSGGRASRSLASHVGSTGHPTWEVLGGSAPRFRNSIPNHLGWC